MATKSGRANWLIGVGRELMEHLIDDKRICIDMERYRVVIFVEIIRCFRCQAFGHTAVKCEREIKCAKFAGKHYVKDCSVDTVTCANCYFTEDESLDN